MPAPYWRVPSGDISAYSSLCFGSDERMLISSAGKQRALLLLGSHTQAPMKGDSMSSTLHSASTSRNLVSVSGFGYRENVKLQEADLQAYFASQAKFPFSSGLALSQLSGQRLLTSASL